MLTPLEYEKLIQLEQRIKAMEETIKYLKERMRQILEHITNEELDET